MEQIGKLESLGSAAAGIAHDINNQLTLILNHLSVTNLDAAREAVTRCASLTAGLLSWCRGESLRLTPLDPAAFLRHFVSSLDLPNGITLHLRIGAAQNIMAEPAALARVLTNLISNACAAAGPGGVICIALHGLTLSVEDSGPGVPPELSKRIFEPFFTTKSSGGAGLGLAIVREIMAQHAGSVTLHSKPGEGSCFELRFRPAPFAGQSLH